MLCAFCACKLMCVSRRQTPVAQVEEEPEIRVHGSSRPLVMKRRRVRVRTGPEGIPTAPWELFHSSGRLLSLRVCRETGRQSPALPPEVGVFRPGGLPGPHAGRCCLGASGLFVSSGALPPPPLPRLGLFTTRLLRAAPHCSVSACGPCDFPHPCWLLSFRPCGCSLS